MKYTLTLLLLLFSYATSAQQAPYLNDEGLPPADLNAIGDGVILCLGMSQIHYDCGSDPDKTGQTGWIDNSVLSMSIVDGGISGWDTWAVIADPAGYWSRVEQRIREAGKTNSDVRLILLKQATRATANTSTGDLISERNALTDHLEIIMDEAEARFPNLQYGFSTSRMYGGHCRINPDPGGTVGDEEPYAYDTINAVLDSLADETIWFLGPYIWADGLNPRGDGLIWTRGDFIADGCHPSESGIAKNVEMYNVFFGALNYDSGNPTTACSDGVDNDGDGLTDFPDDPGCSSTGDNDETDPPPPPLAQCEDGVDNDGDGLTDFPDDPDCDSASDDDESAEPPPAATNLTVQNNNNGTFTLNWTNEGSNLICGNTTIPVSGETYVVTLPDELSFNVRHSCQVDTSNFVDFGCRSTSNCRTF